MGQVENFTQGFYNLVQSGWIKYGYNEKMLKVLMLITITKILSVININS